MASMSGIWKADFVYFDIALNCQVVVDVKGFSTKEYIMKQEIGVEAHYKIKITEVTQGTRKNARKKRAA